MNDLREQCLKIIESLEETIESNGFGYSCLNEEKAIHLLEAFACEQRIKGMEAALIWCIHFEKAYRENSFELPSTRDVWELKLHAVLKVKKQIDAEIQRMREEGE